jgi:hypothetical protein
MNSRRITRILSSCEETARYFKGVYPADAIELPQSYPASMVINLDEKDEPGSHWVAIFMRTPKTVCYFDSYGQPPPEGGIKEFLRGREVEPNNFPIQSIISDVCGHYCIYFIHRCSKGDAYETILTNLARKNNIDAFVRSYVRELVTCE